MSRSEARAQARPARLSFAAAAIMLLPGACGQWPAGMMGSESGVGQPPPGAIKADNRVYMAELEPDSEGCQQYSAWSETGAAVAAVFYRRPDGSFTLFRSEADCSTPTE